MASKTTKDLLRRMAPKTVVSPPEKPSKLSPAARQSRRRQQQRDYARRRVFLGKEFPRWKRLAKDLDMPEGGRGDVSLATLLLNMYFASNANHSGSWASAQMPSASSSSSSSSTEHVRYDSATPTRMTDFSMIETDIAEEQEYSLEGTADQDSDSATEMDSTQDDSEGNDVEVPVFFRTERRADQTTTTATESHERRLDRDSVSPDLHRACIKVEPNETVTHGVGSRQGDAKVDCGVAPDIKVPDNCPPFQIKIEPPDAEVESIGVKQVSSFREIDGACTAAEQDNKQFVTFCARVPCQSSSVDRQDTGKSQTGEGLSEASPKQSRKKQYQCSECAVTFHRSAALQRHMRSHTGARPYKCAECGTTVRDSRILKTHSCTHRGETV